jgi:hypothetical protein
MENDQFNVQLVVTEGTGPSLVGEGFCPRGVYGFTTTRVYTAMLKEKYPVIKFEHKVTRAMIRNDDGTFEDKSAQYAGRVLKHQIFLPTGQDDEKDGWANSKLLGALVGHNKYTPEQAKAFSGALSLTSAAFLNQNGQCIFDPPKPGADGFAKLNYVTGEIAGKIAKKELDISWPQDRVSTKATATAAAGNASTGAGALLAGQAQSFGGLPDAAGAAGAVGGFGGTAPAAAPAANTAPASW